MFKTFQTALSSPAAKSLAITDAIRQAQRQSTEYNVSIDVIETPSGLICVRTHGTASPVERVIATYHPVG